MPQPVYIPENAALDEVLGRLPSDLRPCADHFRWLVFSIAEKRWLPSKDEGDWARLHWRILRRYVRGGPLEALKRHLIEAGAVEMSSYMAGVRSTGYRFRPEFWGPPRRVMLTDKTLCRKLAAFRASRTHGSDPAPPEVIARRAEVLAQMNDALEVLGFARPVGEVITQAMNRGVDPDHAAYVCQVIQHGDYARPTVCRFGYRVHNIITRTAGPIREQLTLDRAPVVELDVRNAQPLLLAAAPQDPARCAPLVEVRAMSGAARHDGGSASPSPSPAPAPLLLGSLDSVDSRERRAFVEVCESGRLYEYLMDLRGWTDRDDTKEHFFACLFGRPDQRHPSTMARTLSATWPTCWTWIDAVKRTFGYKSISQILQRLESTTMIDGVCGRLLRELPGVRFLTVHDSLLVRAEHADAAKDIIGDEFARIGVRATIRRKGAAAEEKLQKGGQCACENVRLRL